jgi:hypothetical protein
MTNVAPIPVTVTLTHKKEEEIEYHGCCANFSNGDRRDVSHGFMVATLSGITPSALRFYEKKGLIKPIGRHGLRRQYHALSCTLVDRVTLTHKKEEEIEYHGCCANFSNGDRRDVSHGFIRSDNGITSR